MGDVARPGERGKPGSERRIGDAHVVEATRQAPARAEPRPTRSLALPEASPYPKPVHHHDSFLYISPWKGHLSE